MSVLRFAVLYTGLALFANAALANPALEALRQDDMKKLIFHSAPKEVSRAVFFDEDGKEMTLADLQGGYVLLNFWATWCAPCRKEMPSLNALQTEFGSDSFRVVTVATGRNRPVAMRRFFQDVGVDVLPKYTDPNQDLARL